MTPPHPPPAAAAACKQLGLLLPHRLQQLQSQPVDPASDLVHAWGTPALVLRCGISATVGELARRDQTSLRLSEPNGRNPVRWYQQPAGKTVIWSAVLPAAAVSLTIPTEYDDQSPYLLDLDPLLRRALAG